MKHLLFFIHGGQVASDVWICVRLCLCLPLATNLIQNVIQLNSCWHFQSRTASTEHLWKTWNLPKPLSLLKTRADRDIITAEILPRSSKNSPLADYFQSKQTGLFGVCWSGAGRWEGELKRSWGHSSASAEVFARIKEVKLDSGKAVLTSFVWSSAAVILGCFLAWKQRV